MSIRQLYNINTQDIGQPRGIGISAIYTNNNDVFKTTSTTKEQVKSNLINFLLTNKGERMFDPEFGGDLRRDIFNQSDNTSFESTIARLENEIRNNIPNINLQSITATPNPDYNIMTITIEYRINQETERLVLNVETNNLSK